MEWIIHEIKPVIDAEYRTYQNRECTGIAGSSMGGLMALYAAVHYNGWFSKAACVSSAIGFCMPSIMDDIRASQISPDTRIFLSWGTKEAVGIVDNEWDDKSSHTYKWNHTVATALRVRRASVMTYCQANGAHCEADWEKQIPEFMDFLWMR